MTDSPSDLQPTDAPAADSPGSAAGAPPPESLLGSVEERLARIEQHLGLQHTYSFDEPERRD